jgi:hypothetical protein
LNLFNTYDLQPNPYEPSKVNFLLILNYFECPLSCGFAINHWAEEAKSDLDSQDPVSRTGMFITRLILTVDLIYPLQQCCFAHIGIAALFGSHLNIPIIVCTLSQVLYQDRLKLNHFSFGLDIVTFLKGGVGAGSGLSDPACRLPTSGILGGWLIQLLRLQTI